MMRLKRPHGLLIKVWHALVVALLVLLPRHEGADERDRRLFPAFPLRAGGRRFFLRHDASRRGDTLAPAPGCTKGPFLRRQSGWRSGGRRFLHGLLVNGSSPRRMVKSKLVNRSAPDLFLVQIVLKLVYAA